MAPVLRMLHMARGAIRLVIGNQLPIGSGFDFAVVTSCTRCPWRFSINLIKRLMAAGTRQRTLSVASHLANFFHSLDVKCVELFAAPLFFVIPG